MKAFSSTLWILLLAACLPVSMLAASYPDISGSYNATVNYVVGFSEHGILVDTQTYSNTSPAQIYASGKGFILTISDPPFAMTTYDPSISTPLTDTVILSGNKVTSMSGRVLSTATTDGGGDVITSDKITSSTGAVGLNEIQISGTGTAGGTFDNGLVKISYAVTFSIVLAGNVMPLPDLSLVVTAPGAPSETVSDANYVFAGLASSGFPISQVLYSLNGSAWNAAGTTNLWENWSADITLTPGKNVLMAYAVDIYGNVSTTSSNVVNYIQTRPPGAMLYVQANGLGSVTPVDNGKLLAIGSNYTLTASPDKNWLFSNWIASGSENFVSSNPVLTFTMQSNLVLTANFATNLFLGAQGAYRGLFAPAGVMREQTNSGSFALNLLSTGAFTGELILGSNTVSLAGKFDVSGHLQTNSPVKGGKPLTTILQLDVANQALSGSVSDGSFVAQLDGDQNVFGPGHPATDYAGQYTWTIPGTNDLQVGPYGTSYGTLTVSTAGDITFAGNLADRTTVSQSSAVSKDGRWPMYLPSSNPNESVFGWNYFTNQTLTAPALVSWINVTNKAKSALYPSGFTNQEATILASYYSPTEKPLLSLAEAQVTLEGGGLPFGITNQVTLAANNAISVPVVAGNTNKLKLTITPKTGLITGSFQNPANAKQTITINGVLLQNQTNAQGYFLGANQSGSFLLENP